MRMKMKMRMRMGRRMKSAVLVIISNN